MYLHSKSCEVNETTDRSKSDENPMNVVSPESQTVAEKGFAEWSRAAASTAPPTISSVTFPEPDAAQRTPNTSF